MSVNAVGGLGIDLLLGQNTAVPGLVNYQKTFQQTERVIGRSSARVEKRTDDLDSALGALAKGAATTALGVGIMASPFLLAERAAGPFADALGQLRAISGASAEQMTKLREAAIQAGIATQFDPTQAAMALGDLSAAGFTVNDSLELLIPTLNLAAGSLGQLSPSDAAGLASQAMKAFGIDTKDAALAVDQMLQSVNVFALAAKDLPLALGTAARGAGTLNQSLDETLVALGLVKNIIPGVERASTAVSTSMERIANPKVQQALKKMGVSATDARGEFRPFLDIVGDMIPQLNKMTGAKRAAFLIDTFGAEALGGFNAIATQFTNGIKTQTGETVRGAAAVAYLRDQFKNASGTAQKFSEELLKDLPGQMRLLRGSISTLGVIVGEQFADVFKPMVKTAIDWINRLISAVQNMSPAMKRSLAVVAVLATSIMGIGVALSGLAAMVGPAIAVVKAGLASISWPVLAAIAAVYALKAAYDMNLGGLATAVNSAAAKVSLAWDALSQLFSQGGFSGAVREEMGKAENSGVRQFAIQLYMWGSRILNFFGRLRDGFSEAISAAEPAFMGLRMGLSSLAGVFGIAQDSPGKAASAFDKWAAAGLNVGRVVGRAIGAVAGWLSVIVEYVQGFASRANISGVFSVFALAFRGIVEAVKPVVEALGAVFAAFDTGGSKASAFGSLMGSAFTFAVATASTVIRFLATLLGNAGTAIAGVLNVVTGLLTGDFSRAWIGVKQIAFATVSTIIDALLSLVELAATALDKLSFIGGNKTNYAGDVAAFRERTREGMKGFFGVDEASIAAATAKPSAERMSGGIPPLAAAETTPGYSMTEPMMSTDTTALASAIGKETSAAIKSAPIVLNVMLDSEQIQSSVASASDSRAARELVSLPPET